MDLGGTSLSELNDQPADAARRLLAPCCPAAGWLDAILAGRPYADLAALLAASDAAVSALGEVGLAAALAGHPRIGDRRAAASGWSAHEQAGVSASDVALAQALATGNADYERRFGHIYLVCATGRSGPELLELLRQRLANEPEQEWPVVAAELAKINRLRLHKLLGGAG